MAEAAPDGSTIEKASKLEIFDADGQKIQFGSLFESEKVIVVFIRHFFCGRCQAYVTDLASVRTDALTQAGMKIVVIGCGDWQPIKFYAEETGFTGPIYADPTRALFRIFKLTETLVVPPSGKPKRSYIKSGMISGTLSSIWRGPLKHLSLIGKQGNFSQLGGDFVFGPGNTCSFSYHMKHSEDHVEVVDLMQAGGVDYP